MRGIYKVPFHDDETATSLAIRLAAANRIPAIPFFDDLGFSLKSVIGGEHDALTRLSEISQISPERIFRNAFTITKPGHGILRDEKVRAPWLARYPARACATCLHEDLRREHGPNSARRYYRIHWQLASIRSCEIHDAPLIELPSGSNYRNFDLDYRATKNTRELNNALALKGTRPFTDYERFIIDRLEGRRRAGELLDSMSMLSGMDVTELIGMYATFGKYANLDHYNDSDWHNGAQAGFSLMRQGRSGIRQFLQQMTADRNKKRSARGGAAILGGINLGLSPRYHFRSGPDYDLIRAEMMAYINEHVGLTYKQKVFGKASSGTHVVFTDAIKTIGGGDMARGLLLHFSGERDEKTTVFPLSAYEKAQEYFDDLVFPIDAYPLLGITRPHFVQLVDRGVIAKDELYKKLFPSCMAKYSRSKLHTLVDAARSSPPVAKHDGLVSLSNVIVLVRVPFADIINLLMERKLSQVHYNLELPGLASILVDPAEVTSHFPLDERWMMASEVATLMGALKREIFDMTRGGILPFHKFRVPGRSQSIFFDRNEIQEFHAKYTHAKALATETGLKSHKAAQLLRLADIPKLRARLSVYYERTAARAALAEAGYP
ncbi:MULTISPECIES: TniQ family protein [unclassified Rhizobium]|uniref:TniQ family protein n=1 Tax=Rhizobium sp. 16-488-2a TaxID=2819990 RepID=UPI001ADAF5A1|nr:TniQ family protein [Rhizobium sp. 16-488-2a]MBO9178269.1 TniQ family protein [Rhizobium sp. 16-488-2a]